MARMLVLQELDQNVNNLAYSLRPLGHELTIVSNATRALEVLNEKHFDMIIAAVYLEGSDVYQFLGEVKSQERLRNIPFAFYCYKTSTFARSIRSGLQIAAKCMGAELYITMEEFDPELLARQIEECLYAERMPANGSGVNASMAWAPSTGSQ